MAEINITPLTDIFLVLLIIFMVTSSVLTSNGVDVNLPQASPQTSQAQPEGIVVSLLPAGKMAVNGLAIEAGDYGTLEASVKKAFTQTKSLRYRSLSASLNIYSNTRKSTAATRKLSLPR